MKIFLPILVLLITSAQHLSAAEPPTAVPTEFLHSDSKRLQEVLSMPITADFREASLRDVVNSIAKQTQVNFVVKLEAGPELAVSKPAEPVFSGHFARTPLRVVLYQISRETNLAVDWFYSPEYPGRPRGISIHAKEESR